MRKVWISVLGAALAVFLCGCARSAEPPLKRFEGSFIDVFDTVTKVVLYETDKEAATARVNEIHDMLKEYHRLFDIYHDYDGVNNIKVINENAGKAPIEVDDGIVDLIRVSKEYYASTGGNVNIALGSVLRVWHDYREAGIDMPEQAELPPMEILRAASAHTDIERVIVEGNLVSLADPDMRLDVGAIAKGYAAQKVVERMKEAGVTSMLISIGGNVCSIGSRADGESWRVSVQSPDMQGSLCTLEANGLSLVTSGTYQRYYTVEGKRYHHIINPETLMPADYFDSVSVLCADSTLADALSTALFNMSLSAGQAFVEDMEGVEAMWVMPDGTQAFSSGFEAYIVERN